MEEKRVPKVAIGCYGGRRGLTISALVKARLREKLGENYHKKIEVYGVGHPKFSKGGKIPQAHQEALEQIAQEFPHIRHAIQHLTETERRAIDTPELDDMDELYSVDTYINDEYQKLSFRKNHIKTISEVTGIHHGFYGPDLDDTEMPLQYVTEVLVPRKKGKGLAPNAPTSPSKAKWYSLQGKAYAAGSIEARVEEARDMVKLADNLTNYILKKYIRR